VIDPALPVGSLLLHVGPHRTATTAVQASLHEARHALTRQRVRLVRLGRHPITALLAATGRPGPDRRVLSSKSLADCDDEQAARVVADLPPDVHVVLTLRPLHAILPSQWQQYVQNGLRTPYDAWLAAMFDRPAGSPPTVAFWGRHRHDALVERWCRLVGPERTTVVVVDPTDRSMLLRTFEQLLVLTDGTLQPSDDGLAERSLTWGEVETLREVNRLFRKLELPPQTYSRLVRQAAVPRMRAGRSPADGEARITTPEWAARRATALGADYAEAITRLGVRVIGDLSHLAAPPDPTSVRTSDPPAARLPLSAATTGLVALVEASGVPERVREPVQALRPAVEPTDVPAGRRHRPGVARRSLPTPLRRGAGS
jgi:hypothetical protein